MKKHLTRRKLKLEVETLKPLSNESLDGVVGGMAPPELTRKEPSWCVCDILA
jgi:hypothetical protein